MALGLWVALETALPPLCKGDLTARIQSIDVKGPFHPGRVPLFIAGAVPQAIRKTIE